MKVIVKALPEAGFRRCGKLWPHGETEAEVSPKEYEILKAEKMLVVAEVAEAPAESPSKDPPADPKPKK